jgi:rfaE bifunctional protein kinase chain/domain
VNDSTTRPVHSELFDLNWESFAARAHKARILVIGDLMLDDYIWGDARRISPEAPVPVVEVRNRTLSPGGAANTAANIAALSGSAIVVGVAGKDHQGSTLLEKIRETGAETQAIFIDAHRPTTTKVRIIARNQQIVRFDTEAREPITEGIEAELIKTIKNLIASADGCVISDYGKGVVTPGLAAAVIQAAQKHSKFTIVDPKGSDYSKYRGATLITPNLLEAEKALHYEIENKPDLLNAGAALSRLVKGAVLITRGADGMSLFEGTRHTHIPAMARNVFDVTGAGDTVVGTLAVALACGMEIRQAAALANVAAGIVVGKVGTATASLEELRAAGSHA